VKSAITTRRTWRRSYPLAPRATLVHARRLVKNNNDGFVRPRPRNGGTDSKHYFDNRRHVDSFPNIGYSHGCFAFSYERTQYCEIRLQNYLQIG